MDILDGGPVGIYVSSRIGSKIFCATIGELTEAINLVLGQQTEPSLLAMFGLKRDTNGYGHPLVPIDHQFTHNEYGDLLRKAGID
jgi:hypothetical protein